MKKFQLVLGVSVLLVPSLTQAHFQLIAPQSWWTQLSDGSPQKTAPCGNEPATGTSATKMVTTVQPGQTVSVQVTATVSHPGWYRISLKQGASATQTIAAFPDPPTLGAAGSAQQCTPAFIDNPVWSPTQPVLADKLGLPAGSTSTTTVQSGTKTFNVTIPPTATCTAASPCTLQVLMFMTDHPSGSCNYHHCADIAVQTGATGGGGHGGAAGSGGGGKGGAAGSASNATGGTTASGGAPGTGGEAGRDGRNAHHRDGRHGGDRRNVRHRRNPRHRRRDRQRRQRQRWNHGHGRQRRLVGRLHVRRRRQDWKQARNRAASRPRVCAPPTRSSRLNSRRMKRQDAGTPGNRRAHWQCSSCGPEPTDEIHDDAAADLGGHGVSVQHRRAARRGDGQRDVGGHVGGQRERGREAGASAAVQHDVNRAADGGDDAVGVAQHRSQLRSNRGDREPGRRRRDAQDVTADDVGRRRPQAWFQSRFDLRLTSHASIVMVEPALIMLFQLRSVVAVISAIAASASPFA